MYDIVLNLCKFQPNLFFHPIDAALIHKIYLKPVWQILLTKSEKSNDKLIYDMCNLIRCSSTGWPGEEYTPSIVNNSSHSKAMTLLSTNSDTGIVWKFFDPTPIKIGQQLAEKLTCEKKVGF